MVPWHTRVYTPKRYLDLFSRLRRDHYCDRQTDHATPSVTISRTYVVLQCGLKRNIIILCTLQLVKKKQSRRIPTPKVIQLTHTKKQTRPIALHGPLQGSEKAPFLINNHHLVDKPDFSYTLGALFTNNLMMSFRPIQRFFCFNNPLQSRASRHCLLTPTVHFSISGCATQATLNIFDGPIEPTGTTFHGAVDTAINHEYVFDAC